MVPVGTPLNGAGGTAPGQGRPDQGLHAELVPAEHQRPEVQPYPDAASDTLRAERGHTSRDPLSVSDLAE